MNFRPGLGLNEAVAGHTPPTVRLSLSIPLSGLQSSFFLNWLSLNWPSTGTKAAQLQQFLELQRAEK